MASVRRLLLSGLTALLILTSSRPVSAQGAACPDRLSPSLIGTILDPGLRGAAASFSARTAIQQAGGAAMAVRRTEQQVAEYERAVQENRARAASPDVNGGFLTLLQDAVQLNEIGAKLTRAMLDLLRCHAGDVGRRSSRSPGNANGGGYESTQTSRCGDPPIPQIVYTADPASQAAGRAANEARETTYRECLDREAREGLASSGNSTATAALSDVMRPFHDRELDNARRQAASTILTAGAVAETFSNANGDGGGTDSFNRDAVGGANKARRVASDVDALLKDAAGSEGSQSRSIPFQHMMPRPKSPLHGHFKLIAGELRSGGAGAELEVDVRNADGNWELNDACAAFDITFDLAFDVPAGKGVMRRISTAATVTVEGMVEPVAVRAPVDIEPGAVAAAANVRHVAVRSCAEDSKDRAVDCRSVDEQVRLPLLDSTRRLLLKRAVVWDGLDTLEAELVQLDSDARGSVGAFAEALVQLNKAGALAGVVVAFAGAPATPLAVVRSDLSLGKDVLQMIGKIRVGELSSREVLTASKHAGALSKDLATLSELARKVSAVLGLKDAFDQGRALGDARATVGDVSLRLRSVIAKFRQELAVTKTVLNRNLEDLEELRQLCGGKQ